MALKKNLKTGYHIVRMWEDGGDGEGGREGWGGMREREEEQHVIEDYSQFTLISIVMSKNNVITTARS